MTKLLLAFFNKQFRTRLICLLIVLFSAISWLYQERKILSLQNEIYFISLERNILEELCYKK